MSRVIAVAGPVGAGKSTLVEALAGTLGDAVALHFDHYERMTEQPIEEVRQWMEEGADLDRMPVPGLPEALQSLKLGGTVVDPLTGAQILPAKHILFETQFGRRHAATGRHIDFLVWIDVPLDIALARKMRQFAQAVDPRSIDHARTFSPWLKEYLDNYLEVVGALLRRQRETVAAEADLVVDGTGDPAEQARAVEQAFKVKHS